MASALWKKLNLKEEKQVAVLNSPPEFDQHLADLAEVKVVRRIASKSACRFLIGFAQTLKEIEKLVAQIGRMPDGDVIVWICYPKKTSKRYVCEFNRDTGWESLGALGLEGVRQVAVDEDWSALRFRRVEFIKDMKRDSKRALTAQGKAKSGRKR